MSLSLLPLHAIEETLGSPPRWTRASRELPPELRQRIDLLNDTRFVATSLCTTLEPDRWRCTLIAKGTFDIRPDAPATIADEQEPLAGDTLEGDDSRPWLLEQATDRVPVKPMVDIFLKGNAYAKPGEAVSLVTLTLGDAVMKGVVALGERRWSGGVLSDPAPFESLPLSYRYAFGGPSFAANPAGTGAEGSPPPRLELPDRLIRRPSDRPPPAGFGPIHPAWQQSPLGGRVSPRRVSYLFDGTCPVFAIPLPGVSADGQWVVGFNTLADYAGSCEPLELVAR